MSDQVLKPIALLGAGSWGSALALYLSRQKQIVRLFSQVSTEIDALKADRENKMFLPGFPFPEEIQPTADLAQAIDGLSEILIAVPSVGFRDTLYLLKPLLKPHVRLICATKGLDSATGQLLGEIIDEVLGTHHPFAVLSGPSFAKEVAKGLPTAVGAASKDPALLKDIVTRFNGPLFRIYPTDDVTGTELGGVVKNVIAIMTGISDGLSLGSNARSAIITQGLHEIIRLGEKLGARMETLVGLSGLGDLILTCSDDQSRNRRLGLALGKGQDIQTAEKTIGQVVEGKRNAELVSKLAKQHRLSLPICEMTWEILQGKVNAKEGLEKLFAVI